MSVYRQKTWAWESVDWNPWPCSAPLQLWDLGKTLFTSLSLGRFLCNRKTVDLMILNPPSSKYPMGSVLKQRMRSLLKLCKPTTPKKLNSAPSPAYTCAQMMCWNEHWTGKRTSSGSSSALLLFSCSVVSDSMQSHGLQQTRLPCPSPSPGACSNLNWCHSLEKDMLPLCTLVFSAVIWGYILCWRYLSAWSCQGYWVCWWLRIHVAMSVKFIYLKKFSLGYRCFTMWVNFCSSAK